MHKVPSKGKKCNQLHNNLWMLSLCTLSQQSLCSCSTSEAPCYIIIPFITIKAGSDFAAWKWNDDVRMWSDTPVTQLVTMVLELHWCIAFDSSCRQVSAWWSIQDDEVGLRSKTKLKPNWCGNETVSVFIKNNCMQNNICLTCRGLISRKNIKW